MEKLIIENRTELRILDLMSHIAAVLNQGRISKTAKGKQYCFVTRFTNDIVIYADKNKKSDRLIISRPPNWKNNATD